MYKEFQKHSILQNLQKDKVTLKQVQNVIRAKPTNNINNNRPETSKIELEYQNENNKFSTKTLKKNQFMYKNDVNTTKSILQQQKSGLQQQKSVMEESVFEYESMIENSFNCDEVLIQDLCQDLKVPQSNMYYQKENEDEQDYQQLNQNKYEEEKYTPPFQKNLMLVFENPLPCDPYDLNLIQQIISQENQQTIDPYYFKNQSSINEQMRAVLIDWMQEVCSEFLMKRQTLYIAIWILDRFMMSTNQFHKSQFQLLGITTMFIASKQEEVTPQSSKDFLKVTNRAYKSTEEIFQLESELIKKLDWNLNPATVNFFGSFMLDKWDLYISQQEVSQIYFRKTTEQSYKLLRLYHQILDGTQLCIHTYKYKNMALAVSIMYLCLGIEYQQFNQEMVFNQFAMSSLFLTDKMFGFINKVFQGFLDIFQTHLNQLLPTIQYCSLFFGVEVSFELPKSLNNKPELYQKTSNLEDFLSICTHNQFQLGHVQKIIANIDMF